MPSSPITVIYHGLCPDGFGAAYAAWLVFGDKAQYVPGVYGKPLPEIKGHDVYVLDFSFEPDVMAVLEQEAARVMLLDHHQSAMSNLKCYKCCKLGSFLTFNMHKSGARMAWEYFHPSEAVPDLIRYIEDRDLWNWAYPETKAYMMQVDRLPHDFKVWHTIAGLHGSELEAFLLAGHHMVQKFESLCDGFIEQALPITWGGVPGLMVSTSPEFTSEVGSRMAIQTGTFGVVWRMQAKGMVKVSLRSVPGFDVIPMAAMYGGGGHAQSASCSMRMDQWLALCV